LTAFLHWLAGEIMPIKSERDVLNVGFARNEVCGRPDLDACVGHRIAKSFFQFVC